MSLRRAEQTRRDTRRISVAAIRWPGVEKIAPCVHLTMGTAAQHGSPTLAQG